MLQIIYVTILERIGTEISRMSYFVCVFLLWKVETAAGAAPPLSLLSPLDSGPQYCYWRAPANCACVEFPIVLGDLSDVSGVTLVVSPCGYSEGDAPTVSVSFFIYMFPSVNDFKIVVSSIILSNQEPMTASPCVWYCGLVSVEVELSHSH